jgi:multidrug efflux system membrane fusion protein
MDVSGNARRFSDGRSGGRGRRILLVLLVLVAIAAVIGLAVWLVHRASTAGPGGGFGRRGGRPMTTVSVAKAQLADVPITLDGLGTVTPSATVTVVPQVSGVITQILFREGQMVKKGEALAVIDPRPLEMALMQAQGAMARDEAQLANARIQLQRNQTLLAQDSIARQDVDTQAALVKQLEGTVTTDRASVGTARLNLGYSRVIAPVAGRVGLRTIDLGNFISAGSTTGIAVITQVAPIDVQFTVPQDDAPRIQSQADKGQLPVVAFDRTKTVTLDQGVFSTLDNRVDTSTGTIRAKARFPNANGTLFPSQFVNVRLSLQTLKDVVVVPVTAVRTGASGDFVWKLNSDRTVSQRSVTRGPGTATTVSITKGVQAGETLITEGGDRLTDGAKVQLPGDKPQEQSAGGANGARRAQRGGQAGQGGQAGGQSAGGAGGQGGQAGGFNREAMMAARQAMIQACSKDAATLCNGQEGRELMQCLRQHTDDVGATCKAAMDKMPRRRPGAGGPGGPGGGRPGGGV